MPLTSSSTNSGSSSRRPDADLSRPRLYRTLKRRCHFRRFGAEDVKWAYAAYRKGSFPEADEGLTPAEFQKRAVDVVSAVNEVYTLTAKTGRGEVPVGIVVCLIKDHRMEPHVFWFAWASARNKIECAVNFINEMRRAWKLHVMAEEKHWGFFTHVCRYGIMKRVGKCEGWFANGDGMMFLSLDPANKGAR